MTKRSPAPLHVTVLYDPLCGWCYGATPAIRRLNDHADVRVELFPTGLFSGEGARPIDAGFAAYAWKNDQRIEQLTGQPFSKRYRDRVLAASGATLDSGPATMALTAAVEEIPGRELDVLEAIQKARYVEGRDVTSRTVLVEILSSLGFHESAARLLGAAPELAASVKARTSEARRLLLSLGARGVPTVVVGETPSRRLIASDVLFGRLDDLLPRIQTA